MNKHGNRKKSGSAYIRSFNSMLNITFCCRYAEGSERSECVSVGEEAPARVELATPVQAKHRGGRFGSWCHCGAHAHSAGHSICIPCRAPRSSKNRKKKKTTTPLAIYNQCLEMLVCEVNRESYECC